MVMRRLTAIECYNEPFLPIPKTLMSFGDSLIFLHHCFCINPHITKPCTPHVLKYHTPIHDYCYERVNSGHKLTVEISLG